MSTRRPAHPHGIRDVLAEQTAHAAVEYAITLSLMVLIMIGPVSALGTIVARIFTTAAAFLENACLAG